MDEFADAIAEMAQKIHDWAQAMLIFSGVTAVATTGTLIVAILVLWQVIMIRGTVERAAKDAAQARRIETRSHEPL